MQKLIKYYEIIIYTILPRNIVNEIFKLIPNFEECVSYTLCYEELTFSEDGTVCKDLALLSHNRTSHHELYQEPKQEDYELSEIMVIDVKKGEECCDMQYVTYFQGRPYDGEVVYHNLVYVNDALK